MPSPPAGSAPDLARLLTLRAGHAQRLVGDLPHDHNRNGRVYGGQLLAQALGAALATVADDRRPTCLQAMFLRGAQLDIPIDYDVQTLLEGKRFSSRRVLATQQGRIVISANVSATSAEPTPPVPVDEDEDVGGLPRPEDLAPLQRLPAALHERLAPTTFRLMHKPLLDMRLVDPERQLLPAPGHQPLHFWLRTSAPVGDSAALHAAALAYLSDYYLIFPAVAPRITRLPHEPAYIASLNHTMWFHRPCRADDWLLVRAEGQDLGDGRALARASVHTRDGQRVITMAQECLLVDRET
jgi:acyl-CoA thioesterase-2